MSYILEALKKAQSERQLGDLPTIHAPAMQSAAPVRAAGLSKPLRVALGLMALLIVGLLALVVRQAGAPPKPDATASAGVAASPAAAADAPQAGAVVAEAVQQALPVAEPVPEPAIATAAPAPAPAMSAAPAPVAAAPAPVTAPAIAATPAQAAQPKAAAAPPALAKAALAPRAAVAEDARPPTAAVAARAQPVAPAQDETSQTLRDLPEPIQRAIPAIAVGGYIYSSNPADRLLLIDKVLRHEGEEVAPGLMLEKLLPKAAVFNFKGYRYRVAY